MILYSASTATEIPASDASAVPVAMIWRKKFKCGVTNMKIIHDKDTTSWKYFGYMQVLSYCLLRERNALSGKVR